MLEIQPRAFTPWTSILQLSYSLSSNNRLKYILLCVFVVLRLNSVAIPAREMLYN